MPRSVVPATTVVGNDDNDLDFGKWLTTELEKRGWTKFHFAQTAGVHPAMVYRWSEGQQPGIESCRKIAAALAVDFDTVLAAAGHRPRQITAPGVLRHEAAALLNVVDEVLLAAVIPWLRALSDEATANEAIARIADRLPGIFDD